MMIPDETYWELLRAKKQYDKMRERMRRYQQKNRQKLTEYHNEWSKEKRRTENGLEKS